MPAALGIGVRVFVGWAPDENTVLEPGHVDSRLKTGTIVGGPYVPPFRVRFHQSGEVVEIAAGGHNPPHWQVQTEVADPIVAECYLSPIDDGEDVAVERFAHLDLVT